MSIDILSNLVITKIHSATTMYTSGGTRIKRGERPCWAIVHKFEGETVYVSGQKHYVSDWTHPVVLPKGCAYEWTCTRSGHYFIIEFEAEGTYTEPLSCFTEESERIHALCRALEQKRLSKHPLRGAESIRDTYSILLLLLEESNKKYLSGEKKQKLLPALDYMTEHYNQPLSNDMLAELCGISTVYFRKLFTQLYGTSPISYMHTLRIKKAKEMLRSDFGSIGDLALSLGYKSIYDFSRAFKRHTGISPTEYKKTHLPHAKQDR